MKNFTIVRRLSAARCTLRPFHYDALSPLVHMLVRMWFTLGRLVGSTNFPSNKSCCVLFYYHRLSSVVVVLVARRREWKNRREKTPTEKGREERKAARTRRIQSSMFLESGWKVDTKFFLLFSCSRFHIRKLVAVCNSLHWRGTSAIN